MATFKVGQRVRRVVTGPSKDLEPVVLGATGTIKKNEGDEPRYLVRWDEPQPLVVSLGEGGRLSYAYGYSLAPLTSPAEDAWAADQVRKVTNPQRYMEPSITDAAEAARERIARDLERGLEKLWGKS